jgi:hypothetical protein
MNTNAHKLHESNEAIEQLYTVPGACSILNIGPTKCWELIGLGELKAVRLGNRCTRITQSSIINLVQNGVRTNSTN